MKALSIESESAYRHFVAFRLAGNESGGRPGNRGAAKQDVAVRIADIDADGRDAMSLGRLGGACAWLRATANDAARR
jgi:hypothetical protein